MITLLVTGDRNWHADRMAIGPIGWVAETFGPIDVVRHGDARGIDRSFGHAALTHGIRQDPHPADWSKGKSAGPIRNSAMVSLGADLCLACHPDLKNSRGTRDCVSKCLAAGIPVYIVDREGAEPRLITEVPR